MTSQIRFFTPFSRLRGCSFAGLAAGTAASLLAVLAAAGCKSAPPPLTAQQLQGKQVYASRCAMCHEDNELALKKVPPNLHGVFDHSTLPSGAPATDAEVRRLLQTGKGLMPPFAGRINEDQTAALLAYLHAGIR
jgi:mono/diheme cytochrome c family protein